VLESGEVWVGVWMDLERVWVVVVVVVKMVRMWSLSEYVHLFADNTMPCRAYSGHPTSMWDQSRGQEPTSLHHPSRNMSVRSRTGGTQLDTSVEH